MKSESRPCPSCSQPLVIENGGLDTEVIYCSNVKCANAKKDDVVNHPSHYTFGKIEVIEAITDWQLNFSLGNAVKYIARAGKKDPEKALEDLKKAEFYIKYEIAQREKEVGVRT